MKKAEEYVKYLDLEFDSEINRKYYNTIIIETIRQAQIDAIEETVKLCAENAEVNINGECDDKFSFRDQDGEWLTITANQDSILNCAEILKQQL